MSVVLRRGRDDGATWQLIEAVYRARFRAFLRVAAAIAGEAAAADVVHDSFVRALRYSHTFRGGDAEAWLWRIVVNTARSRSRVAQGAPSEEESLLLHEPASDDPRESHPIAVQEAVLALPPRQRAAIFLRYYSDLDYAQIAEVLGVRVGTVAASLHAAHHALREVLQEVERC